MPEQPHQPWRTPVIWGSIGLVLVLVVVLVWAFDGFDQRMDRLVKVPPGTLISTGPYELTLTEATVQHVAEKNIDEIVLVGTGRTTGDTTIAPPAQQQSFVKAQDPATKEVQSVNSYRYGDGDDIILKHEAFIPGLAPIPFTATFRFDAAVGDSIRVVVFDQEFSDKSPFGNQDPTWNRTADGHDLTLSVKRLPERTY